MHIEHLDETNYGTWNVRMKFLLINKGLWSTVDPAATPVVETT